MEQRLHGIHSRGGCLEEAEGKPSGRLDLFHWKKAYKGEDYMCLMNSLVWSQGAFVDSGRDVTYRLRYYLAGLESMITSDWVFMSRTGNFLRHT